MTALVQEGGQGKYYTYEKSAEKRAENYDGEEQRMYAYFHEFQTGTAPESV